MVCEGAAKPQPDCWTISMMRSKISSRMAVNSATGWKPGWEAAAPLPVRTRPSAMVHSKTAKLRSEQAVRTSETARISSTVSITTIGVEEYLQPVDWLWNRSSERIHLYLTRRDLLSYNTSFGSYRNILLAQSRTNKGN